MPLSRLENFLKNVEGNILYVNPDDLDATDSIENQGNSLTRPFKTIQRALLEASRFSYQIGQNNDKFNRTTILLYPGTHEVDNRPGYNVINDSGTAVYRDRNGNTQPFTQLTDESNYNLDDSENDLYKYNSVEGGAIVPRGVSIVGLDLRKTNIRPKFVPDPTDDAILRSAIFRITGGCYFWQFTIFDGDVNGSVYRDYTANRYVPNYSHHKLTVFEYADGVNGVGIGTSTTTTDLAMYYHKIQRAYGDSSGRAIGDFPGTVDMQAKLPEFEIVGPVVAGDVGISSIKAGAGSKANTSTNITVDCATPHNLVVDSAFRVTGIDTYPDIYNGNFVVTGVSSDRVFTYKTNSAPIDGLPLLSGDETIVADTDTVTGASPYIFNISLRSTFGMCGMHADGSKATGFKSMVVAQYTGVGLQKDDNAFLLYNSATGQYDDVATVADSEKPLYLNSSAVYKPSYENFHVKCSNKSVLQVVSVFAIGYAQHFLAESGGDQSITNSNSNFGAKALISNGFQDETFTRDNRGYISHIVPPQRLERSEKSVEWVAINVGLTTNPVGIGTTQKIFLDGFTDPDVPPAIIVEGFRVGARAKFSQQDLCTVPDVLQVALAGVGTFSAPIRMLNGDGTSGPSRTKEFNVGFVGAANSISSSVFTLQENHTLYAGESIRVISDDGSLPDGIDSNEIYFAVTNDSQNETLNADQIKLARTENEAILGGSGNFITIDNNKGGRLRINSRVADKLAGDFGHPVQYDTTNANWYVNSEIGATNTIHDALVTNGPTIGPRTNKTFFTRKEDNRALGDKIYKLRYVIPKQYEEARPPIPGFVIQESSTVGVVTDTDFSDNIPNATVQRNISILKSIDRDGNTGITTIVMEKPHGFALGDRVQINNVKSTTNTAGVGNSGYNTKRSIVGITSAKGFEVNFTNNPGAFIDDTSSRGVNLPTVARQEYKATYTVYRVETLKAHEFNKQDGVYHLICVDSSITPTVNQFGNQKYNQQIENLYPQFDADNFTMDPAPASSFAVATPQGKVVTNDLRYSITKEFANRFSVSNGIGIAVTFAEGSTQGISTIYTEREHNLNTIISVGLGSTGANYGTGITTTLYNASLVYSGIETGRGATANIDVDANGGITAITIVDGGSAYGVGHTLNIVGVTTSAGHITGWVTVNKTSNNIGDAIEIVGVGTSLARYVSGYNGIHTITSITPQSIEYNNGFWPGYYDANTVGLQTGFVRYAGPVPDITSIVYSSAATGIVTVTTAGAHGLNVNNPFKIVGVAQTIYNVENIVNERIGINTFTFKFNEAFTPATYTAGGSVLPINYGARGGRTEPGNERIGQRLSPFRTGIQTAMSATDLTSTGTTLTLGDSSGFKKGDYIQIDNEIIRVSSDFASNAATVLRGQLGSRSAAHDGGSLAKQIDILATEKRRHSILRASGHTFEYLGFGPGNYSTGLPQKQDRVLSREEQFLSQSQGPNGGAVVYTGMNDAGDFYIGNKVINSQDGTEATFNIPVPTTTGATDDAGGTATRLDAIFDSVTVREGLTVDGNNSTVVKLNAPTTISEKLTSTSPDGAEFVTIDINGGLAQNRTITYSPSQPTGSATLGDITFNSSPSFGQYLGWVFTNEGWKRFGLISTEIDETKLSLNTVGVGSTSAARIGQADGIDVRGTIVADAFVCAGVCTFSGATTFASITFSEVVIGVTSITSRLDVQDEANFSGITTFESPQSVDFNTSVEINPNLFVAGISTFQGNVIVGNAGSDSVSVNAAVDTTVLPDSDLVRDLGSNAKRWRDVYAEDFVGLARSTTNVVVADESSDTTCFPLYVTAATGVLAPKSGSNLTFNSSTGVLGATIFAGSGAQLTNIPNSATTATSANSASAIVARDGSGNFTAGTISAALSGNATSATTVATAENADNSDKRLAFVTGSSGNISIQNDAGLVYNPSTNLVTCSGDVLSNSDAKLKENVTTIENGLEKVQNLRGVEFDYKANGTHSLGVIAQEVEAVLPELVAENSEGIKSVAYQKLTAVLIEAVKEQQKQIDELKAKVDELSK